MHKLPGYIVAFESSLIERMFIIIIFSVRCVPFFLGEGVGVGGGGRGVCVLLAMWW